MNKDPDDYDNLPTPEFYFTMDSDQYGWESFGPYDSEAEAYTGMMRVLKECRHRVDGVVRTLRGVMDYDPEEELEREDLPF